MEYRITPIGKPRMTQSDKWKHRSVVDRYMRFKDECRAAKVKLPDGGARVTFILPMPDSWPINKKENYNGTMHRQKPDLDNLLKSLLDAVHVEDCTVWHLNGLTKRWGMEGAIIIE